MNIIINFACGSFFRLGGLNIHTNRKTSIAYKDFFQR